MENYEQKYKEALERCKKEFNFNNLAYSHEQIKQKLEHIFPELKEKPDDKRMWTLIKKYAHCNISDTVLKADHITREYLESWLEKQDKQKQVSITDEWIENYWQHEKVNNPNSYDKGDEIQFDHDGFIRFCKDIANRQKEQTINKARKWLAGNVINYIWKDSGGGIGIRDDFFIDVGKAMEE